MLTTPELFDAPPGPAAAPAAGPKLWMPRRVVFTPAALAEEHGQRILERCRAFGLPIEELPANRLSGLRGADERETYRLAKITPGSKEVLRGLYPASKLEMDETRRAAKRNKFGGTKYVYPKEMMTALRGWFEREIARRFPQGRVLYWT